MDSTTTFGDFQSLLQLSVGLNLTFSVIVSLFSSSLEREKKIAESLCQGAEFLSKDTSANQLQITELRISFNNLRNMVSLKSEHLERLMIIWVRSICLACSALAFGGLVFASFHAHDEISTIFKYLSAFTLVPFVIFAIYAIVVSIQVSSQVAALAQKLPE